jgi:hypothetical protein
VAGASVKLQQQIQILIRQLEKAGIKPAISTTSSICALSSSSASASSSITGPGECASGDVGVKEPQSVKVYLVKEQLFEELQCLASAVHSGIIADCELIDTMVMSSAHEQAKLDAFKAIDRVGDYIEGSEVKALMEQLRTANAQVTDLLSTKIRAADRDISSSDNKHDNRSGINEPKQELSRTSSKSWSFWGGGKGEEKSGQSSASSNMSTNSNQGAKLAKVPSGLLSLIRGGASGKGLAVSKPSYTLTDSDWDIVMNLIAMLGKSLNYLHCRIEDTSSPIVLSHDTSAELLKASAGSSELNYQLAENNRMKHLYRHMEGELCRVKLLLAMCQEKLDDKLTETTMLRQLLTTYMSANDAKRSIDADDGGVTATNRSHQLASGDGLFQDDEGGDVEI